SRSARQVVFPTHVVVKAVLLMPQRCPRAPTLPFAAMQLSEVANIHRQCLHQLGTVRCCYGFDPFPPPLFIGLAYATPFASSPKGSSAFGLLPICWPGISSRCVSPTLLKTASHNHGCVPFRGALHVICGNSLLQRTGSAADGVRARQRRCRTVG